MLSLNFFSRSVSPLRISFRYLRQQTKWAIFEIESVVKLIKKKSRLQCVEIPSLI